MASISHLRPRSAEADASASRGSSSQDVALLDPESQVADSHATDLSSPSSVSMQRLCLSVKKTWPAVVAIAFILVLALAFTDLPNLPYMLSKGRQASTLSMPEYDEFRQGIAPQNSAGLPQSMPLQKSPMTERPFQHSNPSQHNGPTQPSGTSYDATSDPAAVLPYTANTSSAQSASMTAVDSVVSPGDDTKAVVSWSTSSIAHLTGSIVNNTANLTGKITNNIADMTSHTMNSNNNSASHFNVPTSASLTDSAAGGRSNLTATDTGSAATSQAFEAAAGNFTRKAKLTSAPRQCPALVIPHDYHPDDLPPHNHAQAHIVHSKKSLTKPPEERVLIVAANSGGSCGLRLGDYYTFLSMLDKLQYGNLHGYDVLLGMGNIDPALLATWNKVGWMMKALNETSREEAEWILWMDLDTIAVESDIAFPLASYTGKDLVLWIMPGEVLKGNPMSLNTGVMLIRNTDWARGFIADVARLGRQHVFHWQLMDEVLKEELTGAPFASGLFDQNVVAYLMKRYPANIMPHVYAANLDFRINENWIDYIGYNFSQLHSETDTILVSHFSGCSMCAGKDNNENLTLCESEFQRTFEFANCTYGDMMQSKESAYTREVHAMLSQLPFCRHKPTPTQCLQYMDADLLESEDADVEQHIPHHRHVLSQR